MRTRLTASVPLSRAEIVRGIHGQTNGRSLFKTIEPPLRSHRLADFVRLQGDEIAASFVAVRGARDSRFTGTWRVRRVNP